MAAMVLVFVLFSFFYIAVETGHNCTEDDCPVCACIQQCEMILHQMGDGVVSTVFAVLSVIFLGCHFDGRLSFCVRNRGKIKCPVG